MSNATEHLILCNPSKKTSHPYDSKITCFVTLLYHVKEREIEIGLAGMEDFVLKSPNSLCHFQLNAKNKK